MKIGTAYLEVDGDFKPLDRSIDRNARRMSGRFKAIGKGAAIGFGAGIAGAAIAGKSFIDAQIESEKSGARLRTQLKASGKSYKQYGGRIESVMQAQSRLSGLDDEDLQDSFTNIVRVTGDVNEALKLNAVAADFARAKNIDVAKAGEIVGKVAGGNTGVLSRYGIVLKEGATTTEALAALQQKFSGQAKAYGETTAGASDRLGVAWENIKETIGGALAPTFERVADGAGRIVSEIDRIAKRKDINLGEKIRLSTEVLKERLRPIARELGNAVERAWPGVQEKIGTLARKAAGAFIRAWWASDWWVKLFTGLYLAKKLGVFSTMGGLAAARFNRKFKTQMLASAASGGTINAAAAGAGTAAGTAFSGAMLGSLAVALPTGISFILREIAKSEGTDTPSGSSVAGPDGPRDAGQALAIKLGRKLGLPGAKPKPKPKAPRHPRRSRSGSRSGGSSVGNQGRRAYGAGENHFHLTVPGGGNPDWRTGAMMMADELRRRGGN